MGRPPSTDGLVPLNMRVPSEPMRWLTLTAGRAGVSVSERARAVLSRGRACEELRCPEAGSWKRKASVALQELQAERERNAALNDRLAAPVVAGPWDSDWGALAPVVDLDAPHLDPRAWIPVASWRSLDDRALAAKGCCVEHRQMRESCDAQQLHDEGR